MRTKLPQAFVGAAEFLSIQTSGAPTSTTPGLASLHERRSGRPRRPPGTTSPRPKGSPKVVTKPVLVETPQCVVSRGQGLLLPVNGHPRVYRGRRVVVWEPVGSMLSLQCGSLSQVPCRAPPKIKKASRTAPILARSLILRPSPAPIGTEILRRQALGLAERRSLSTCISRPSTGSMSAAPTALHLGDRAGQVARRQ